MKFEINQPSKQLDEKEQSLKAERELLEKQKAEPEERLASTAQTQIVTTVATTVAETKPEQPIIDDMPFGEEEKRKAREVKSFDLAPTRNYETSWEQDAMLFFVIQPCLWLWNGLMKFTSVFFRDEKQELRSAKRQ